MTYSLQTQKVIFIRSQEERVKESIKKPLYMVMNEKNITIFIVKLVIFY